MYRLATHILKNTVKSRYNNISSYNNELFSERFRERLILKKKRRKVL